jgi:uncharacterized protein DUF4432
VDAPVSDLPVYGSALDVESLRRLTGHPGQVAGAELLRLEDGPGRGVRIVRLRSGEVDVDVVVDRALDIAGASVRGVPVAWLSPTGVAGPWFAEPHGLGTFRTFFGGLLTTCGLDHTLGPTEDTVAHFAYPGKTTDAFPLHGRVGTVPATLERYGMDADLGLIAVEGTVRQATVFGEHLVLHRRIELDVGGATLRLTDTVRNAGYAPTPHMVLYHVNVGWPVLAPSARVHLDAGPPRVATEAAAGVDWRTVDAPRRGAVEQVWEHTPVRGRDGRVRAAVLNTDLGDGRAVGVEVAYDPATLPRLFQWRVMNEGHYVVGLEPGNLRIEGRQAARDAGDLVVLEPGAAVTHRLELSLLHGPDVVHACAERAGGTGEVERA